MIAKKYRKYGSYPYISGDTFRGMADHVFDEKAKFNPKDVKPDQIVFVKGDMVDQFFEKIHPAISNPYKLVTHNSDHSVSEKDLSKIDEKIICWFAENAAVKHSKIIPIPIGLENLSYHQNGIPKIFTKTQDENVSKLNRIVFGFNVKTNPTERSKALNSLQDCTVADKIMGQPDPWSYARKIHQYKFIAAPQGNGLDSHRIWESILLDIIPIVRKNPVMEYFQSIGLPLVIVNDWQDIKKFSEAELESMYEEIMGKYGPVKNNLVAFHYWQGIIRSSENTRSEAIVSIVIGKKYQKIYAHFFKPSHERLAFDLRRPLIIIDGHIQKTKNKPPAWQKQLIFRTPILSNIQRVMLIDADIYIKDTNENPFEIVPQTNWGLVPNNAFNMKSLAKSDQTLYNNCPLNNRPSFVLNTGFYVVNKKIHSKTMEYVFNAYDTQVCEEQGPFCYHLINELPGTILPFKFNNIVATYMDNFGYSMTSVMNMYHDSNFLHFAGGINRKILRLFIVFEKYPVVAKFMQKKLVLKIADKLMRIIKKVRQI